MMHQGTPGDLHAVRCAVGGDTERASEELAQALAAVCPRLCCLQLKSNALSAAVPGTLAAMTRLRELHLDGGPPASGPGVQALLACTQLTSLAVPAWVLPSFGGWRGVGSHLCNLVRLEVVGIEYGARCRADDVAALLAGAAALRHLALDSAADPEHLTEHVPAAAFSRLEGLALGLPVLRLELHANLVHLRGLTSLELGLDCVSDFELMSEVFVLVCRTLTQLRELTLPPAAHVEEIYLRAVSGE